MTLEPFRRRGGPPPAGRENRKHSGTLCTANRRDGQPCTNFARLASTVCRMHGGSAPQVLRAAQVRLLMASDRLMAQLLQIAENKAEPTPVRLAAIRDALDRAGLGSTQQVEIRGEVQAWERHMEEVLVRFGDEEGGARAEDVIDAEVVEDPDAAFLARLAEMSEPEQRTAERERRLKPLRPRQPRKPDKARSGRQAAMPDETPAWFSPHPLHARGVEHRRKNS